MRWELEVEVVRLGFNGFKPELFRGRMHGGQY
jgi:hypothetical protein